MERFPSTLATQPPLAGDDQPTTNGDPSGAKVSPRPPESTIAAPVGDDRPCHLPIAWASRPDLDHGHVRPSA